MKIIKNTILVLLVALLTGCAGCVEHRPTTLVIEEVEIANKNIYRYLINSVTPSGTVWDSFNYYTYDFIGMPGDTVKLVICK